MLDGLRARCGEQGEDGGKCEGGGGGEGERGRTRRLWRVARAKRLEDDAPERPAAGLGAKEGPEEGGRDAGKDAEDRWWCR